MTPQPGKAIYVDPTTSLNYFYPYGCFTPSPLLQESIPDDSVDLFNGLITTYRAQIQWRLNVQRITLAYNFNQFRYGLDPTGVSANQSVYAQTSQSAPITGNATFQFQNLGPITGDTGMWRAGDGNPNNILGTMDGYSYAMPVAVVFQRNSGPFVLGSNVFGCADPLIANSGLIQYGISGRFDSKLADQIYADDTVDVRQTVSIDDWDYDTLTNDGFVDVISGNLRAAIGRGISPGMSPSALGSTMEYYVSMSPTVVPNTNTVGSFDGFSNGFSSDQRTFFVTKQITINSKSVGINGGPWVQNDAFTISLPNTSTAVIASAFVQGFNTVAGVKTPINLLAGQVLVSGLNSKTLVVSFPNNLSGTSYDPGANNLYLTLGVSYPAGGTANLIKTPFAVDGGTLYDATSGKTLPVYGVSEYAISAQELAAQAFEVLTYNPEYSSVQFGTRIFVEVAGSLGVQQTVAGGVATTFIVPNVGLNGSVNGLYIVSAFDSVSNAAYTITSRTMSGGNCIITIQGAVPLTSTVVMVFMAQDTVQAAFNAPVKGITELEETVLFGTFVSTATLRMDTRVVVESVSYSSVTNASTVVLAAKDCTIKGISGRRR